jgi:two-component system KDP operon response regulator KdpE
MKTDRVLIVEEDPNLQRLLRARLLALGYDVQVAERGEDALVVAADSEPDLILIAVNLPGIDGVETIRRLREWSTVPVIALNGEDQASVEVEALDAGADDYVLRPFRMSGFLARMRAVMRRSRETAPASVPTPLTFRNLCLDLTSRRVLLDRQPLHLTPTEYELLCVLATHAGRVLTHRELLRRVWGPTSERDTQYLHVFISQLRRKLECRPNAPRHILTETGVGYEFAAEP